MKRESLWESSEVRSSTTGKRQEGASRFFQKGFVREIPGEDIDEGSFIHRTPRTKGSPHPQRERTGAFITEERMSRDHSLINTHRISKHFPSTFPCYRGLYAINRIIQISLKDKMGHRKDETQSKNGFLVHNREAHTKHSYRQRRVLYYCTREEKKED